MVLEEGGGMNKGIPVFEGLINLGAKSGMPRYVAFLGLLQTGVLFVPEEVWSFLGVDALQHLQSLPGFVQYYINSASFKNAMYVFWLMSPFTLSISTVLSVVHINFQGYPAYLKRRAARLKQQGKASDYSLVIGTLVFLVLYIWGTGIYLVEPGILGNFVPAKSRLAMLIIHAGSIAFLLPVFIAMLITELRANLSESAIFRK